MGVNLDKPQDWKADIAQSVDMYNEWFMKFAPKAFRDTRIETTKSVEATLHATDNIRELTGYRRPKSLRGSTAPRPQSRDGWPNFGRGVRRMAVPWLPPGERLAWLPAQAFHHFDFAEPKRIDNNFAFIKSGFPDHAFGSQLPSKSPGQKHMQRGGENAAIANVAREHFVTDPDPKKRVLDRWSNVRQLRNFHHCQAPCIPWCALEYARLCSSPSDPR